MIPVTNLRRPLFIPEVMMLSRLKNRMSANYHYAPLFSQNSIRLLKLEHGSGDDELVCSLLHSTLEEHLKFETISYCWGGQTRTRAIKCEGKDLLITENLYDALRKLRNSKEPRLLWADAICINQDDLEEKSNQVRLMRQIYEKSFHTRIWLGSEQPHDRMAVSFIYNFAVDLHMHRSGIDLLSSPFHRLRSDSYHSHWLAFSMFMQRPWFFRVWIVQELAVSRDATFMFGEQELPVGPVLAITDEIEKHRLMGMLTSAGPQAMGYSRLKSLHNLRKQAGAGKSLEMIQLLAHHSGCEASDRRDKIYALLGLASDGNAPGFMPNYKTSIARVYSEAAKQILRGSNPLRLFAYLQKLAGDSISEVVPSWVPTWHGLEAPAFSQLAAPFKAGGLLPSRIILSDNRDDSIILRGLILTDIERTLSIFDREPETFYDVQALQNRQKARVKESSSQDWIQTENVGKELLEDWRSGFETRQEAINQFLRDCRSLASHSVSVQKRSLPLWRLIICNRDRLGQIPSEDFAQGFETYASVLDASSPEQSLLGLAVSQEESDRLSEAWGIWADAWEQWWIGRRAFMSRDGRFGYVPWAAQAEDLICVFEGSEVPHVIRPFKNGTYQILGECYMDGIMDGEVLSMEKLTFGNISIV